MSSCLEVLIWMIPQKTVCYRSFYGTIQHYSNEANVARNTDFLNISETFMYSDLRSLIHLPYMFVQIEVSTEYIM